MCLTIPYLGPRCKAGIDLEVDDGHLDERGIQFEVAHAAEEVHPALQHAANLERVFCEKENKDI